MKYILVTLFTLAILLVNAVAQDDILNNVPKLQETARRSNAGQLGCGIGVVTLITSKGDVRVQSGLDAIHVFGSTIRSSDLLALLDARAKSNRTGIVNPMSGEVSDLAYVAIEALSLAKDPDAVPVIAELLNDKDDVIRGWSAIALYEIAKASKEMQTRIQQIEFPQAAVSSASSRGVKPPKWVLVATGN